MAIKKIVAGLCLARSTLVCGFGCRRCKVMMTWFFDTQPDLNVYLRATLKRLFSEAAKSFRAKIAEWIV